MTTNKTTQKKRADHSCSLGVTPINIRHIISIIARAVAIASRRSLDKRIVITRSFEMAIAIASWAIIT